MQRNLPHIYIYIQLLKEKSLSPKDVMVFCSITYMIFLTKKGCELNNIQLAKKNCTSPASIQRSLKKLSHLKYIQKTKENGKRIINIHLDMPYPEMLTELQKLYSEDSTP